ncbi:hypothetical protein GWK47_046963 [Chionoecetes opilio]|uniref:Uncharacterized protein n=1 Tax=Chionoecetes opilio TaxID=41210 RepID=A0A8J4Y530_CHIOP|nr:hypothetical protein GWK47_046963 [Chionoecetes opilio]
MKRGKGSPFFPPALPNPPGRHVRHVGGELGDRRPRRRSPKGAVGQSRAKKRPFRPPWRPNLLRPGGQNPEKRPWKGGSKRERPLEEGLWTVAGPEQRPGPRAPEPGRPHPDGTTRILGAIQKGGGLLDCPSRREEPQKTTLPDPPGKPPGRDGRGPEKDTRVTGGGN